MRDIRVIRALVPHDVLILILILTRGRRKRRRRGSVYGDHSGVCVSGRQIKEGEGVSALFKFKIKSRCRIEWIILGLGGPPRAVYTHTRTKRERERG